MSQSWEQALVNAQTEVNRCVFEMNTPGALPADPWYKDEPDPVYILEHLRAAIKDLEESEMLLALATPVRRRPRAPRRRGVGRPRISRQLSLEVPA